MKSQDLRALTDEELQARLGEARDHLFNLRVKHTTGQLEDSASLRAARRDLARALTVSRERSRAK